MNRPQIPDSARDAFETYPKIQASPAFNRAVLERLQLENARRKTTLLGRLEEALGLSAWRFAASGMLGALVPGVLLLGFWWTNRGVVDAPQSAPIPMQVRAMGPFYAREWEWARAAGSSTKRFRRPNNSRPTELQGGVSCGDVRFPLA